MPAPMPPPGAGGPGGAPPAPSGEDASGGPIGKLIMNIDQAIDHLNMVVGQSSATSPEEKQMINQIDQLYGKFMQSIGASPQGPDEDDGAGAQGQTVPAEAAGNKKAIPSMI